ncbi:MAG: pilus assembly protein [Actinobacteria bacterium]|nr:pilus assembly protein [Actinomycetota bacterium]
MRRSAGGESGQSSVELALITPVLLVFILGSITLMEVVQKRITVSRLASEGARLAVNLGAGGRGEIEAWLRHAIKGMDSASDERNLSVHIASPSPGEVGWVSKVGKPVKVTVTYNIPVPLLGGLFGGTKIPVRSDVIVEKWPNAVWFDIE